MSDDTQEKTSGLRNLLRNSFAIALATAGAVITADKGGSQVEITLATVGLSALGLMVSAQTGVFNRWRVNTPPERRESDFSFILIALKSLHREEKTASSPVELNSVTGD